MTTRAIIRADERRFGGRRSRVVLTPRRWCQARWRDERCGRWEQESPVPRESTKDTVKTIAQGMPVLGSSGRRNTPGTEVAMGIRRKRSTRARLGSLGRPPVAGRAEQELFWRGIAAGLNSED